MSRKPAYVDYYVNTDYDEVLDILPRVIKKAEERSAHLLEPTVNEKHMVMDVIKGFIRDKKRKVYGGTALNEAIKKVNPKDAIYSDTIFSDIEFYSPTPAQDLVEICNLLYKKKFKYVTGGEAQHEETYNIFVNFQLYCDISYAPLFVYNGIQTIEIDGILYVHPHFMLIDYLRMSTQPLTAAGQRWEKAFKRMFLLLANYPLEYYDKPLKTSIPSKEVQNYIFSVRNEFMMDPSVQPDCLLSGYDAYNFFIKNAAGDRDADQQARVVHGRTDFKNMVIIVPFTDLICVQYTTITPKLYSFLKNNVKDPSLLTVEEYNPFFQFTGNSTVFKYNGETIVRIIQADGYCVPGIKTRKGYMYVSFQYLLMAFLINKFRMHLEKDKQAYFNYGIAISNLVTARNYYLDKNNLPVISENQTDNIFGEFLVNCIGSTMSYSRIARLRSIEKNKPSFKYTPEKFFSQSEESQKKLDPSKHKFKNTSGNKIIKSEGNIFKIQNDKLVINEKIDEDTDSDAGVLTESE